MRNSCRHYLVDYRFEDYITKDQVTLYLYFTGQKDYDWNGPGQSSTFKIGWKLYDDGYVVKDGIFYSPSLAEGERFRNEEVTVYFLKPGNYELRLSNVN